MRWSTVALVSEQMLRDLRKWFAVAKLGGIGVMHGAGALDAVAALLPDYEFEPTVMQVDIYGQFLSHSYGVRASAPFRVVRSCFDTSVATR